MKKPKFTVKQQPSIKWTMRGFSSSRPEAFCTKGVLKNFAKFTGKHLCFPVNFKKFSRTCFFIDHLW